MEDLFVDLSIEKLKELIVSTYREKYAPVNCDGIYFQSFTERPEDALTLMRAVDSPHFRIYWQPFQTRTVEQNLAYLRALAPYVTHLHVFQWKGADRFPLADGIAEWQAYLALLDTPHTLLLEFMPDDRLETLAREADALRQMIGENA